MTTTKVNRTDDFAPDGAGGSPQWAAADWLAVRALGKSPGYETRAKLLYSSLGLYCLFDCEDRAITSSGLKDGDDLWHEDVVEAFFWPDERMPVYFEYEISPLGAELP